MSKPTYWIWITDGTWDEITGQVGEMLEYPEVDQSIRQILWDVYKLASTKIMDKEDVMAKKDLSAYEKLIVEQKATIITFQELCNKKDKAIEVLEQIIENSQQIISNQEKVIDIQNEALNSYNVFLEKSKAKTRIS